MLKRLLLTYLIFSFFCGCTQDDNLSYNESLPSVVEFGFSSYDNPFALTTDISCDIIRDSLIEGWVPNIIEDKRLVPNIVYNGDAAYINGTPISRGGVFDFNRECHLSIEKEGHVKNYKVKIHSFTGLPVVWIDTEQKKDVVSKEEYINARLKLVEDISTYSDNHIVVRDVSIKGRGNSTWQMPKKPYRLKFDE